MTSPALTAMCFLRITIFPFSIAAGNPAFWKSPTIGPAGKAVGPASITISDVAISPPLAGACV